MTLFRAHNNTSTMGSTKIAAKILFSLLITSLLMVCANSDDAKDKEECTQQLVGLATCLPYVEGNAKAPTPDCCSGLKQVLKSNKKCLCVVIKHRNDPDLGLTINVTLALGLPTVCSAPANVTKCPELLHLPPNSPDAQVFYQFGHNSSNSATSPASSPITTVKGNHADAPAVTSTTPGTSAQQKSEGCQIGKRWFGLEATVVVAFIGCFVTSNSII